MFVLMELVRLSGKQGNEHYQNACLFESSYVNTPLESALLWGQYVPVFHDQSSENESSGYSQLCSDGHSEVEPISRIYERD